MWLARLRVEYMYWVLSTEKHVTGINQMNPNSGRAEEGSSLQVLHTSFAPSAAASPFLSCILYLYIAQ